MKKVSGQSLIELVLALGLFSIIAAGLLVLSLEAFGTSNQGKEIAQALSIAQEGIEAMRAVRDRAWNKLRFPQGQISINGNAWTYNNNPSPETIGKFSRAITVADVCRDINGDQVTCPGNYTDVHTKKITATINWTPLSGIAQSLQSSIFLTNWDTRVWNENIKADFDDGVFNNTVSTTTIGDGNGSVVLIQQ